MCWFIHGTADIFPGGDVVKAALSRGKACEIVKLDWLEDSMLARRRLPEERYSHRRALKRKLERERKRLMVVKGLEKAVKEVNPSEFFFFFLIR